jgi:hypothetical protein
VELINLDTSWRLGLGRGGWGPRLDLLRALLTYPLRPAETMAGLVGIAGSALGHYDAAIRHRPLVGLAGADAHAKLALLDVEPGDNRFSLPFPGYGPVFQTLSIRARLDRPLTGDAAADGAGLLDAIRRGRVYAAVDGLATPPAFEFRGEHAGGVVREGERIDQGPVTLSVRSNAPPTFRTVIRNSDRVLAAGNRGTDLSVRVDEPGAYRVEIRAADRPGEPLWLLSNPIYVGTSGAAPRAARRDSEPRVGASHVLFDGATAGAWRVETDARSRAELEVTAERALRLQYWLADGPRAGQFAALAVDIPRPQAPFAAIAFSARAESPMRISVQLRWPLESGGVIRRQRSVYVGTTEAEYHVAVDDMRPAVGETSLRQPPLDAAQSLMFVVELTHAKPGAAGTLLTRDIRLAP